YSSTATDVLTSGVKWNGVANCGYTPPTYSYSWTPATNLSNDTISNPVASPIVTTTYEVSVTSSNSPGCPTKKQITVTVLNTSAIDLTSAVGTNTQTVCQDTVITDITYVVNNATDASVTGLPAGLNGTYASGIFTISGTPTVSGTYNYVVTTSGGCAPDATATGTITVNPLPIINLTSEATTSNQTVCQDIAITNITYSITDATGAIVVGLPSGVTGTYISGVFTISGTPVVSGTFNYTVTSFGGCDTMATGTIIVNPIITPIFTQVAPICSGSTLQSLTTTSNEGITGTWSPALNNPTPTTYTRTPDAGQCASIEIMIIEISGGCEIPKGISPNGDGLNDVFDLSNFNITKLSIFNRYGIVAYTHGFGYKDQWYGQSNSGQE
ncbi:MAG: gliding motility-associated C-terminal domain-containing protein, partial [Bacteroidia bacterium]